MIEQGRDLETVGELSEEATSANTLKLVLAPALKQGGSEGREGKE